MRAFVGVADLDWLATLSFIIWGFRFDLIINFVTGRIVLLASNVQDYRYHHLELIDKNPLQPSRKLRRKTNFMIVAKFFWLDTHTDS